MLPHAPAAEIMRSAWRAEHGADPSARELLWALAVAALETSYGQGWIGKQAACKGSNNWGARQATKREVDRGDPVCVATDSNPDRKTYSQAFKVYPSPEAGARDVVRLLTRERPRTWRVMRDPSATVAQFSDILRRDRYYGGHCLKAAAQFGDAVNKYGDPTDAATRACHAEAVATHARNVHRLAREIAPVLGIDPPELGQLPGGAVELERGGSGGGGGGGGALLLVGLGLLARRAVRRRGVGSAPW